MLEKPVSVLIFSCTPPGSLACFFSAGRICCTNQSNLMHSPKVKSRVIILVLYNTVFIPIRFFSHSLFLQLEKGPGWRTLLWLWGTAGDRRAQAVPLGFWAGLWGQVSLPPTCSPGKTDPSVQCVSQELLGLWKRAGMSSLCCSCSLPSCFHFKYFSSRKKKKTSMRTEIALDKVQPDWLRALSYPRAFLLSSQCGGSPAAF